MSFNLDELNRAFTQEGVAEAVERASWVPDGTTPEVPIAGQYDPPVAPAVAAAEPERTPDQEAAFRRAQQLANGLVQQLQQKDQALASVAAMLAQQEEAQFQNNLRALQAEGRHEEANTLLVQRAGNLLTQKDQQAANAIRERDTALQALLVDGFTQQIYQDFPNLPREAKDLIENMPYDGEAVARGDYRTVDQRRNTAAMFDTLAQGSRNQAAAAGAAMHIASGAGRAGGAAPNGAAVAAPSGRGKTALEILRETPYIDERMLR